LYFDEFPGTRNVSEEVTVLNFVALGYWAKLNYVNISNFGLQGFGTLFLSLNNTIKNQAIGKGISQQFLSKYSILGSICQDLLISDKLCKLLWEDENYGLDNSNNYAIWIDLSFGNNKSSEYVIY
jgi:hypothetical protein